LRAGYWESSELPLRESRRPHWHPAQMLSGGENFPERMEMRDVLTDRGKVNCPYERAT
jgi:hypothetical protein